jgi:hypothetical protein
VYGVVRRGVVCGGNRPAAGWGCVMGCVFVLVIVAYLGFVGVGCGFLFDLF